MADKFTNNLSVWYTLNHRELPWRASKDPYKIWLSEIILQQTRVAQGTSYYQNFVEHYPTIYDFERAPLDDILKLWQGLGYYSRARNMHKCAHQIVEYEHGQFPQNYARLIQLIGIGKYTAAAIASICFDQPVPAIDGNAFRVYARYFGIYEDISLGKTFKIFFEQGQAIMPRDNPGDFNQAVMELGARICLPKKPLCEDCPVHTSCFAKSKKEQHTLPIKTKKIKVKDRYMDYVVLKHKDSLLVHKREGKDIWQGLYDFLLFETDILSKNRIFELLKELGLKEVQNVNSSQEYKHLLSHQKLHIHFHLVEIKEWQNFEVICQKYELEALHISKLEGLAVPKPIETFLASEFSIFN
ncbi:A/G-specific adenine glycosylase [Reichenbachiella sp. 5M10]|nr:A/G-specific adenine glycosylase [Reichenbachiella sp. 5M10]